MTMEHEPMSNTITDTDIDEKYIDEQIAFMELDVAARGDIEAGPEQQDRLDDVTDALGRGDYHIIIEWDHELKMLIARCVDGRIPEAGAGALAPNAAGGTESIFVADDLTTKRYASEDGTTVGGYQNVITALQDKGYVVGGHTSAHPAEGKSGCGANDQLDRVYDYIAKNGDTLRGLTESFGISVPSEFHTIIVDNAAARGDFSTGRELLDVLEQNAPEEFVDKLHGEHNEVVAVINKRPGTTLDRDALKEKFGDIYQAFNVDAWAFEEAARTISGDSESEVQAKIIAMCYYNLATTMVLAGPKMRVVVLD